MADVRNPTDSLSWRGVPSYGNNPARAYAGAKGWDALVGNAVAPGASPAASITAGVTIESAGGAAVVRSVKFNIKNLFIDLGAADFNGIKLMLTDAAKPVMWLGGNFNIAIVAAGGAAMDTGTVEVGVGAVVAAADPIATTQQNIVTLKAVVLAAKLGTAIQATPVTPLVAAPASDVFLNVSCTEAAAGYSVTLNGIVELFYLDFAAVV